MFQPSPSDTTKHSKSHTGRHKKVKKLFEQHIEEKLFSSWSMKFAPFNNIEWGNKEFDEGKFKNISAAAAVDVFQSIKEMING